MRRSAWTVMVVSLLGGCMSPGPETGGGPMMHYGKVPPPPSVPGVKGPYGEKVAMAAPYAYSPPANEWAARMMMANNLPLGMVQMNPGGMPGPGGLSGMMNPMMPPGGLLSPPGLPAAPGAPGSPPPGLNPASFPGAAGGGVINAHIAPGEMPPGGVVPAQYCPPGSDLMTAMRFPTSRSQVRFTRPGMRIAWYTRGPDGKEAFSATPIETPGRYNFAPGVYRLKLSNLPGRPLVDLYPTLEVVPANAKTEAFLAHNSVPLNFSDYDIKQVTEGNYLVKVIYLPDPQFQDVAGTGTDEIVNNPLEPGMDPIQEALRRGSILLIIRMGNVDQDAPGTPPLTAPGAGVPPGMGLPPGGAPGMAPGLPGMGMSPPFAPGMGGVPPGMLPDPRMMPLFQFPMYGGPTPPVPPGLSGAPLPGVTPLPPGLGARDIPTAPVPGSLPPGLVAPPPTTFPLTPGKDDKTKTTDTTKPVIPTIPTAPAVAPPPAIAPPPTTKSSVPPAATTAGEATSPPTKLDAAPIIPTLPPPVRETAPSLPPAPLPAGPPSLGGDPALPGPPLPATGPRLPTTPDPLRRP
ncbi:MAG: hypothetical protein U0793_33555 [Gemmataceae bacterium]